MTYVTIRLVDSEGEPVSGARLSFSSDEVKDPVWIDEVTDDDGYTTGHYRARCDGHSIDVWYEGRCIGDFVCRNGLSITLEC